MAGCTYHCESLHIQKLNGLSRLCGERTTRAEKDRKKSPKLCLNFADELKTNWNIQVEIDADGVSFSKTVCVKRHVYFDFKSVYNLTESSVFSQTKF